jgi:hypothetical protein
MGPDPEGLVSYCKSVGVVAQAYSPLGPTYNTTAKNELIEGNLTVSIGKHYNKSGAQVGPTANAHSHYVALQCLVLAFFSNHRLMHIFA